MLLAYRLSTPVELTPNARFQALPEAGARYERRLEAVACKPLFGNGLGSILCYDMGPQPRGELLAVYLTRGHLENNVFLLVDSSTNFVAMQH